MPPFAVSAVVNLDLIKGAMTLSKNKTATVFAISAAALYAINVPLSKLLLINVLPRMLAGFLYLGAGVGIGVLLGIRKTQNRLADEQWLDKKDLAYTIAMIGLDIAAPIFLMLGIANTNSANVSLINNFEIVATSVIALATVYKGNIIKNLIMDCQSYTKYRPNETTGGIFVSWRRKEELPTGLD